MKPTQRNKGGRPTILTQPVRVNIYLSQSDLDWLRSQPGGTSATIRRLIQHANSESTKPRGES